MRHILILALFALHLGACAQNKTTNMNEQSISITQIWDKTFPLSEKVNHKKVTFKTQYGFTLVADLYIPKTDELQNSKTAKPALVVSGPFGAIKEQCSGLYAMNMAERGFVTLAFDPSFTGESSGEPR
ncbi:MAG: alpha/beta hydrolase, partial [bacterium]|nr:alpha/beta hydrolase [Candidatus Minthenecus merdequi]